MTILEAVDINSGWRTMSTMVLPRRLLYAPTEKQIHEVLDTFIAENVKKAWEEV